MLNLPIEIINKILIYVGELNNDLIILQYNPYIKNQEFYKINMFSDLLWNIKTTMIMHRIYPIYYNINENNTIISKDLYVYGKKYYENLLRKSIKF